MTDVSESVPPLASSELQPPKKKKLTLSFEEYKSISNMLVVFVRNEEEKG